MKLLPYFLVIFATSVRAQADKPATRVPAAKAGQPGFQTGLSGWVIQPGDTLQLGSRPGKVFTSIYRQSAPWPVAAGKRKPLGGDNSGAKVILKELVLVSGQLPYGLISIGKPPLYYVELDKAINTAEILPPIRYRPSARASPAVPVVVARDLIKLQAQLDSGLINQEQFNAQKKKLLDH